METQSPGFNSASLKLKDKGTGLITGGQIRLALDSELFTDSWLIFLAPNVLRKTAGSLLSGLLWVLRLQASRSQLMTSDGSCRQTCLCQEIIISCIELQAIAERPDPQNEALPDLRPESCLPFFPGRWPGRGLLRSKDKQSPSVEPGDVETQAG